MKSKSWIKERAIKLGKKRQQRKIVAKKHLLQNKKWYNILKVEKQNKELAISERKEKQKELAKEEIKP